jgi:hypothetical protein
MYSGTVQYVNEFQHAEELGYGTQVGYVYIRAQLRQRFFW